MSKRSFLTASAALATAGLVVPPFARPRAAHAAAPAPVEGTDYRKVDPPQRTEVPADKIEVVEFFWYACPHCYALEPVITDWASKLPPDVALRRVHVSFRAPRHQQLHYALVALGEDKRLGMKVFDAIHNERKRLMDADEIFDWAKAQGLDDKKFRSTFESFGVRTAMKRATQQVEAYGVDGVPSLAVAGKYMTAPSMAGSNGRALEVVDALLATERKSA